MSMVSSAKAFGLSPILSRYCKSYMPFWKSLGIELDKTVETQRQAVASLSGVGQKCGEVFPKLQNGTTIALEGESAKPMQVIWPAFVSMSHDKSVGDEESRFFVHFSSSSKEGEMTILLEGRTRLGEAASRHALMVSASRIGLQPH